MRVIWKMKVSEDFYQEVLEETKTIIKDFNEEVLVNWKQN